MGSDRRDPGIDCGGTRKRMEGKEGGELWR